MPRTTLVTQSRSCANCSTSRSRASPPKPVVTMSTPPSATIAATFSVHTTVSRFALIRVVGLTTMLVISSVGIPDPHLHCLSTLTAILSAALDTIPTGWYCFTSMHTNRGERTRERILAVALRVFRARGYAATSVDDLCREAGVTKGAFFHHFKDKESLALAAVEHWNRVTSTVFDSAPYHRLRDPRRRLLAYLDFRQELVRGRLDEFTCMLGTLVQEVFSGHPALRAACGRGIDLHARTLVPVIEAARTRYAPGADWRADDLAHFIQAVIQGSFVLAKAFHDRHVVVDAIEHLKRHVELLLPVRPRPAHANRRSTCRTR